MNGPAVASSGRARRTERREMASISAVYYTTGGGEGIRRENEWCDEGPVAG